MYSLGSRSEGKDVRLEYESLFSLGPLCGINDPEVVLRAANACDAYGLDTISTGGTIAFLMECVERGLIDGRLPGSGRVLSFGDGLALQEAIDVLVERRGETRGPAGLGEPSGGGKSRRGGGRSGPSCERARTAGLSPRTPSRDGAGPGGGHPGGGSQPLRGL